MRRSRNASRCPKCQARVEPGYRFCLVCGAQLAGGTEPVEDPVAPVVPEPALKSKGRWGKKSKESSPAEKPIAEMIAADFTYIRPVEPAAGGKSSGSSGAMRFALMLLILVAGAVGGTMYWNSNQTNAKDKITWDRIAEYDYAGIWDRIGNGASPGMTNPEGIPSRAVKATVVDVAADGTIFVEINDTTYDVRLAGVPADFAGLCLGDKAMARIGRVLEEGAVVYVALDGKGKVTSTAEPLPAVYIWRDHEEAGKIRYLNEELILSGETGLVAVTLASSEPGKDLVRAQKRAEEKLRGRYGAAAC